MRCSFWYEDVKGIEVAVDCALIPDFSYRKQKSMKTENLSKLKL